MSFILVCSGFSVCVSIGMTFSLKTLLCMFFVAVFVVVFFLLMTVFLCCLQDIFMFITRQLKGLEDTKSAQFNRYFYLLEVCESF